MKFIDADGATLIDEETKKGLIPPLTMQHELNAFEHTNISIAVEWAFKSKKMKKILVSVVGIQLLHQKMFNQTWKWAGKFRQKQVNMGVHWIQISEQLKVLCDDVIYWEENDVFDLIEIAVRFHHRLVQIHPFLNGNGRVSRLAADLFLFYRKQKKLTWGKQKNLIKNNPDRRKYIVALQEADEGDYKKLIQFATLV